MHNKLLRKASFYLLLLFALCISVYPLFSFLFAAAICIIWLIDLLIFKETNIYELPLFYPLLGFNILMAMIWLIATIYGHPFPLIYIALLSLFYMIIPGIVITIEQRQMIIWTFIAGALVIAGLQLIYWWATFANFTQRLEPLGLPSVFMVALAAAFLMALYAESPSGREKLFLALVALPLTVVVIFSSDKSAIFFLIFSVFLVGILRDLTVLIPLVVLVLLVFSGAFGIDYYFERELAPESYQAFIVHPVTEIRDNYQAVLAPSFFGNAAGMGSSIVKADARFSFFLRLLINAGPPALLMFLWVLFERAREAYLRRRRTATRTFRAYHLISIITIVAILTMNLYGAAFEFPAVILTCWLILGMTDL